MGGCIAPNRLQKPWQMIWRDLFVFAGLLFKSKAPQNLLLRLFVVLSCGSVLCVAILGSDVGQNRSENVGDHKLVSDLAKNRSENSPTRLKTGRRFSFSDLSPTINAQPAVWCQLAQ